MISAVYEGLFDISRPRIFRAISSGRADIRDQNCHLTDAFRQ
jgi:hypothetical protein